MDELWDDYLLYLIWRGGLQNMTKYSRLFEILHNIKFIWLIDRDENREGDGIELRDDYEYHNETLEDKDIVNFMDHWCSVLEMMIGLSIRVDDEFIGDPADEHPEEFFMEMIENLGLDVYKGKRYREEDVIKIVRKWLERKFDRNGNGSPFPVKNDCRDQRKLEIWDQMNSYIYENYG